MIDSYYVGLGLFVGEERQIKGGQPIAASRGGQRLPWDVDGKHEQPPKS